MRALNLIERHQKNVWMVELFSNGSILVTSFFKRKPNQQHCLAYYQEVEVAPKYVKKMVRDMRKAHPHYAKVRPHGNSLSKNRFRSG